MSSYHDIPGPPMEKVALGLAAKQVGKSLLNRGLWGTVARGGEHMAAKGGRTGRLGNAITDSTKHLQRAMPVTTGYGFAGLAADAAGYNLPGSDLALAVGQPGFAAAFAAPAAMRSARLATGNHNDAIINDAKGGAQQAGYDWLTAMRQNPNTAYDPAAYRQFLIDQGMDVSGSDRYRSPAQMPPPPGMWRQLGHAFTDPNALVIPHVQRKIQEGIQKHASVRLEKSAWVPMAINAAKGAWQLGRAAAPSVLGRGVAAAPKLGMWRSGKNAIRAGVETTGVGRAATRGWDAIPQGLKGLTAPALAYGAYDTARAATEEKPYDALAVQQEGYDGANAALQQKLSQLTPFQRQMLKLDPSLAAGQLEKFLPGTIAGWEQQTGQAHQPGFLGGIANAWSGVGANIGRPNFYSTDAGGNRQYLNQS